MASFQHSEGASINRPPLFNGVGYSFWKIKMKAFIEGLDVDVWEAIENGPHVPKETIENKEVDKPRSKWTSEDKKLAQPGLRAKNIIISALGHDEFCRISNCKTAKEMWDDLEVTHEGTSEVKRSRINTLTREFELFMMNQNESIQDMQKRFTHIVNQLESLGKGFQNEDLVNKILRCLSREWQPKVTAITESRNLATMSLPTLFGKLQEHELELNRLQQNEDNNKKTKSIALKATSSKQESDDESIEDEDEAMAMLAKKFNRFFKRKEGQRRPPFQPKKNFVKGEGSSQPISCFECGKQGHYRNECPNLKGKDEKQEKKSFKGFKKGKRAYIAWDENDMDSSDDSEDEEANLCLMAGPEEDEILIEEVYDSDYDDLKDAFLELHKDSMKIASDLNKQKKENDRLKLYIEKLKNEIACLTKIEKQIAPCIACDKLKREIDDLNVCLAKFVKGKENLDILLGKQNCSFKRAGIGYDSQQKLYNSFFVSPKAKPTPAITCTHCNEIGHKSTKCEIRKYGPKKFKMMWVVKGSSSSNNSQGPKEKWVPKT